MSSAPTPEDIGRDATWLAQALDPARGIVRFVAMSSESYREASFLDDRLLQSPVDAEAVPWPQVEAAVREDMRSDARWIFHIGHVGSTLVSRLLGELEGVLALREPRFLRDLRNIPPELRHPYAAPTTRLMSRTFATDQTACVKATSFVSGIAPALVPPGERALFIYAGVRNYVGNILAGPNSIREMHGRAPMRNATLKLLGIDLPQARNEAELAAIGWASEMATLETVAEQMKDRKIAWADFDLMLGRMESELARIADFFGFTADAARLQAIVGGPLMTRYSKALEYEYSPALRRDIIAESESRNGREIDGALAMIAAAAEKSPLLARVVARAGEG